MIDQNLQPTIDLDSSSPSEFDSGFPAKPKYVNNPNRKKREAKINPDYEAAIIKILYKYRNRRNGLTTKSAVVEHIFENKSFTKSESDKQVSSINSHMTGYKTQCEQLYEFYINLATKDKIPETREEVIALAKKYSTNNSKKLSELFHAQLTSLTENIENILKIDKSHIDDDSPEIESIRELFRNGDITANLPTHRNIAYRLNIETDHRYFGGLSGKQNSGENRRVLEQVLIHNTHFIIETYNRTHIKFLMDFIFEFDERLAEFNANKFKYKTGLTEIYEYLITLNRKLEKYKNEVAQ
ncbi:hypothetical protein [Pseudomonas putida]|uniref:hypothetical protein n=1 Tax=Pseudomonas putida TaxID=303 RepID=UPI0037CB07FC